MGDVLTEFEAAIKAATAGPWHSREGSGDYGETAIWAAGLRGPLGLMDDTQDAELIVLLRNNAGALLAVAKAAREIEWCWDGEVDRCPSCGAVKSKGHDHSCNLGAALASLVNQSVR